MGGNLTVSEVKSNLRKKFYFFPGVYDYPPKLVNGWPTYLKIEWSWIFMNAWSSDNLQTTGSKMYKCKQ